MASSRAHPSLGLVLRRCPPLEVKPRLLGPWHSTAPQVLVGRVVPLGLW